MAEIVTNAVAGWLLTMGWMLTLRRVRVRRRLAQQREAAVAGRRVDLTQALSRSTYNELSSMLEAAAEAEQKTLAARLVTFTRAAPLLVASAVTPPEAPTTLRFAFVNGWHLTLTGVACSTRQRLLRAVPDGLWLTEAELVGSLATRVNVTWRGGDANPGGARVQTLYCRVAALVSPLNTSFI